MGPCRSELEAATSVIVSAEDGQEWKGNAPCGLSEASHPKNFDSLCQRRNAGDGFSKFDPGFTAKGDPWYL